MNSCEEVKKAGLAFAEALEKGLKEGNGQTMTNAEKFREVFGFTPNLFENVADTFPCLAPLKVCEINMNKCKGCPFSGWWGKEYKACFEIKPEFEGVE